MPKSKVRLPGRPRNNSSTVYNVPKAGTPVPKSSDQPRVPTPLPKAKAKSRNPGPSLWEFRELFGINEDGTKRKKQYSVALAKLAQRQRSAVPRQENAVPAVPVPSTEELEHQLYALRLQMWRDRHDRGCKAAISASAASAEPVSAASSSTQPMRPPLAPAAPPARSSSYTDSNSADRQYKKEQCKRIRANDRKKRLQATHRRLNPNKSRSGRRYKREQAEQGQVKK